MDIKVASTHEHSGPDVVGQSAPVETSYFSGSKQGMEQIRHRSFCGKNQGNLLRLRTPNTDLGFYCEVKANSSQTTEVK